jgi:hypothetical protein
MRRRIYMLRKSKPQKIKVAVKLFPRLATPRVAAKAGKIGQPIIGSRAPVASVLTLREAQDTQVRARLLRMILDNEDSRRTSWRPNAS